MTGTDEQRHDDSTSTTAPPPACGAGCPCWRKNHPRQRIFTCRDATVQKPGCDFWTEKMLEQPAKPFLPGRNSVLFRPMVVEWTKPSYQRKSRPFDNSARSSSGPHFSPSKSLRTGCPRRGTGSSCAQSPPVIHACRSGDCHHRVQAVGDHAGRRHQRAPAQGADNETHHRTSGGPGRLNRSLPRVAGNDMAAGLSTA